MLLLPERCSPPNTVKLSDDYILGLIDGEGCFTFCVSTYLSNRKFLRRKIPAFALAMHERDMNLIKSVRDHLGIRNKVYIYHKPGIVLKTKTYLRGDQAFLIVREIGSLKNIIVPFFYKRLKGYKRIQFEKWIEKIGTDPLVPEIYKIIHRLHSYGYYERISRGIS